MFMYINIPIGEVFDRLSIAIIKYSKTKDRYAGQQVTDLSPMVYQQLMTVEGIRLFNTLMELNEALWDCEDNIRYLKNETSFIQDRARMLNATAEQICNTNDRRAYVKRAISALFDDDIGDQKYYENKQS